MSDQNKKSLVAQIKEMLGRFDQEYPGEPLTLHVALYRDTVDADGELLCDYFDGPCYHRADLEEWIKEE